MSIDKWTYGELLERAQQRSEYHDWVAAMGLPPHSGPTREDLEKFLSWEPAAIDRRSIDAAALMEELAERFRERNGKYKDNWRNLGDVMVALYPEGITLRTADDFVKFHLLEWTLGKVTRFVNSDDGDSIEDAAVYAAMIGSYLRSLA